MSSPQKKKEHKPACTCHKCLTVRVIKQSETISMLSEQVHKLTYILDEYANIFSMTFEGPSHMYEAMKGLGEEYEFTFTIGDTERQKKIEG